MFQGNIEYDHRDETDTGQYCPACNGGVYDCKLLKGTTKVEMDTRLCVFRPIKPALDNVISREEFWR